MTLYERLAHALTYQLPIALGCPGNGIHIRYLRRFPFHADGHAHLVFTDGTTFTTVPTRSPR